MKYNDNLETTLLIGNGLNRTLTDGVEWSELLKGISEKYNTTFYKDQDMPMEFERIINEYLQKSMIDLPENDRKDIYLNIKREIADVVKDARLDDECIHKSIPFEIANNIITTNYDHLLEKAYGKTFYLTVDDKKRNIIKYLEKRFAISEDNKISYYHAHGSMIYPNTICLGYEHYMGIVERLRRNFNRINKKYNEMNIVNVLKENTSPEETWGEKFYTTNMAIIGFGLPTCETDIWWLLNHRAYLYNSNYNQVQSVLNNKIVYYDVVMEDFDENEDYNSIKYKHKLLENLHVEVRTKKLITGQTFKMKYQEIFDEIRQGEWL